MESIHNHPYGYNDDCKSCKRPYWHRPHPPKQGSECNICQKIIEIFRCKDDRKYMVGFREESFYGYPCALCENPARMWARYIPSDFCEPVCFDCVEENGFMINRKNCWWTNIYRNVKDCDMIRQVQKWGYETVEDFLENRDNKTKIAIRSEKTITKKINDNSISKVIPFKILEERDRNMYESLIKMKNFNSDKVTSDMLTQDVQYAGSEESGPFLVPFHDIKLLGGTYEIIDCLATSSNRYEENYTFIINGIYFTMGDKTIIKTFNRGDIIRGYDGCKLAYVRRISEHEIVDDVSGILSKGMKIPDELQSLASEDTCVGYWDLRTHRGQIDYVGKDSRYRVPWDGKMTESDDYIYDLVKRQI